MGSYEHAGLDGRTRLPLFPPSDTLILIRGAGDLATGAAWRLARAGFPVAMTELPVPTAVRLPVCFSSCIRNETVIIEGIMARRASLAHLDQAWAWLAEGVIPVFVDPEGASLSALQPIAVVDGRVAKHNIDTTIHDAPFVAALGPGFTAGIDCHAVIETNRGHHLGRVYWTGSAEADTGAPATVGGIRHDRVLRAPSEGHMVQLMVIGNRARQGDRLARVGDVSLAAPFDGVVRGLIDDETYVTIGLKIGDLDPRARREYCFTISDKSLAVGAGVVEAILAAPSVRRMLQGHFVQGKPKKDVFDA